MAAGRNARLRRPRENEVSLSASACRLSAAEKCVSAELRLGPVRSTRSTRRIVMAARVPSAMRRGRAASFEVHDDRRAAKSPYAPHRH